MNASAKRMVVSFRNDNDLLEINDTCGRNGAYEMLDDSQTSSKDGDVIHGFGLFSLKLM
jgi:hypothetical protein